MAINLSQIETSILVEELAKRKEVQLFSSGIYKSHDVKITTKYQGSKERVLLPKKYDTLIISFPD
ncbi:hypothetical protein ACOJIU_04210 [Carnobacterium maltaromaticum]|uniref:hypothetical protein n=1 Tax=Carnobacterium maltaromaticum TaxID=2751 RepID=UPI003B986DD4